MNSAHSRRWRLQFPLRAYFMAVFVVAVEALLLKHSSEGMALLLRLAVWLTATLVFRLISLHATQATWRIACAAVGVMLVYLALQGRIFPQGDHIETWTDKVLASWHPYVSQRNPHYDPSDRLSQEFLPDLPSFLDCGSLLIGINLALLVVFIGCHLRWDSPPADDDAAARWSASGTQERLTPWRTGDADG